MGGKEKGVKGRNSNKEIEVSRCEWRYIHNEIYVGKNEIFEHCLFSFFPVYSLIQDMYVYLHWALV